MATTRGEGKAAGSGLGRLKAMGAANKPPKPTLQQSVRKQVPGRPTTAAHRAGTPYQATRKTATTFKPNVRLNPSQIDDRRNKPYSPSKRREE